MLDAVQALLQSGLPVKHTALGAFNTTREKATALLLPINMIELLELASEELKTEYKLNSAKTVAVATDVYFNEDMKTCPRGVKLQLLGQGGVAVYGEYNGDSFWIGWCAVPRRHQKPEASLEELSKSLEADGYDLEQLEKDSPYYINPYA